MDCDTMILEWSDDLSTGVEWQDNQHKTLVDQINKIYNNQDSLEEVYEFTKYYATTHFRDEEAMMIHYDYPNTDEHIEEHGFFINSMQEVSNDDKSDSEKLKEVLNELSAWLIWHIKHSDYEQAEWFANNSDAQDHQPTEFYDELEVFRSK